MPTLPTDLACILPNLPASSHTTTRYSANLNAQCPALRLNLYSPERIRLATNHHAALEHPSLVNSPLHCGMARAREWAYLSRSGSEPRPKGSNPRSPGSVPSKYFGGSVSGSQRPRAAATGITLLHAGRGRAGAREESGAVVPTKALDICVSAAMLCQLLTRTPCCGNNTLQFCDVQDVGIRISRRYALAGLQAALYLSKVRIGRRSNWLQSGRTSWI